MQGLDKDRKRRYKPSFAVASLPGVDAGDPKLDEFAPKSSFLESVKYDRKAKALDITFKSGSTHRYLFVFPATFETFRQSPDHSSFYARAIKGKLMSVPINVKNIGRNISTALKHVKQRRTLDAGVKRIAGTVARAGL